MREGVRHAQRHHFVRNQVQSPPAAACGRITAGEHRHLRFYLTIALEGSPAAGRVVQHLPEGVAGSGLVLLAYVVNRPPREASEPGDFPLAFPFLSEQQDARPIDFTRALFAVGHKHFELRALGFRAV